MSSSDGRRSEFEREALPYLDALYGLALRLTGGDEGRSEDLVQEAALKAYRSWDRFEPGTNCRAWMMTILRNTFINEFRRDRARPNPVEYDEIAERPPTDELYESDPEGRIFDRIIDRKIIQAIQCLPDDFRIPVVLADIEGLAYQQIAEELDVPVGTVKSRLFRARKRLQHLLYEYALEMGFLR